MKPIGLFKRGGGVPKSFYFEKPIETMSSWKCFSKYSVTTRWWSFFCSG